MPLPRREDPFANSPIKKNNGDVEIVRGRVVRSNTRNWTVDVQSSYDQRMFLDIQVASPYMHPGGGSGWFGHPLEKSTCLVCIPSDTTPPFVLCFLAPLRGTVSPKDAAGVEATTPEEAAKLEALETTNQPSDARFDGNRPDWDSGDFGWRGPEGNQVVVYRNGMLVLGSSEINQRVFFPRIDKTLDLCAEYEMQSPSGCVHWGVQERTQPESQWTSCYRVFANDEYADVRVRAGKVDPLGEPAGDKGESERLTALGIGQEPVVLEVCMAKGGFSTQQPGTPQDGAVEQSVWRFFFDRKGGMFLRCEASALIRVRQDMHIRVGKTMRLEAKNIELSSTEGVNIDGGSMLDLKGTTVQVNGGTRACGADGDSVIFPLPVVPVTGTLNGQPFVGTASLGAVTGLLRATGGLRVP